MPTRTTLTSTILVAIACGSGPVLAHEHDGHDLTASDAAAIAKLLGEGKMTLTKAVKQADNISGGWTFSVSCMMGRDDARTDSKMVSLNMNCIADGELWDVHLNDKGALFESGTSKPKDDDKHGQAHWASSQEVVTAMKAAKMPLVKAIEAAEKHANGTALAAAAVMADKTPIVCVHCLVGDKVVCVHVALDGKVTDAPAEKSAVDARKP